MGRSFVGYGWVGRLVGFLLLAAASAKLFGWNYQPVSETAWLAIPAVRMAAVVLESLMGLWLLTGFAPIRSWLASLGVFTFFAGVSAYSGWRGVASCGCFGAIQVSPWITFGLDIAVLLALSVFRPRWERLADVRQAFTGIAKYAGGAAVLAVACWGVGRCFFASPQEAMAFLRGEHVIVEQETLDLGIGCNGEWKIGKVGVRNRSARPVRIIGGHSDCSCVMAQELPVTIEPGELVEVPIHLQYPPASTGSFWKEVQLVTDDASQAPISVLLVGRVVPKEQ
jgi:hypothetical protein